MIWDDSSANFCYKCMTCIFSKTMRLPDELHEKSSYNKSNGTFFGKGVYRPLLSPWPSPVVLTSKKSDDYTFCVNYRKLNIAAVKYSYSLPSINDMLDTVAEHKFYSTLDMSSVYRHC